MAKAYVNGKIVDNGVKVEKKAEKEVKEKGKKRIPLTPEEKVESKKAKQEAREKVIQFCLASGDADIIIATKMVFPNCMKAKKAKENAAKKLLDIIGPEGTKHEDLIWKASHVGRMEMTQLRKKASKLGAFCNFSMVDGLYRIVTEKEYSLL
jgi:membrane-associated HD superfamily phosphohydrolase